MNRRGHVPVVEILIQYSTSAIVRAEDTYDLQSAVGTLFLSRQPSSIQSLERPSFYNDIRLHYLNYPE